MNELSMNDTPLHYILRDTGATQSFILEGASTAENMDSVWSLESEETASLVSLLADCRIFFFFF